MVMAVVGSRAIATIKHQKWQKCRNGTYISNELLWGDKMRQKAQRLTKNIKAQEI